MRAIIKASIRLIIVYLFISLILVLNNGISQVIINDRNFNFPSDESYVTTGIIAVVIATLVSTFILIVLWLKTDWIVRKLAGEIDERQLVISTSNVDLFQVGLKFLGFFLIFNSIPRVLGQIAFEISLPDEPELVVTTSSSVIRQFVTDGARILIGFGLLFWESRVKRMVSNIRDIPKPQRLMNKS